MHYVYQITNLVNGKVYVGRRKSEDPVTDSYMGSGTQIRSAIKKYGLGNFKKEILAVFNDEIEAAKVEATLVTKEFCLREDTYNMHEGGYGGFSHVNDNPAKRLAVTAQFLERKQRLKWFGTHYWKPGTKERVAVIGKNKLDEIRYLANSVEAMAKKKETWKKTKFSQGENNSQYGSMWITDGSSSKKISKDSSIPEGWEKGRVIKQRKP